MIAIDRPIIFSDDNVLAILAGRKTQTRRIAKSWRRIPFFVGQALWVKQSWDYFGGDEYLYQQEKGAVRFRSHAHLADLSRTWRNPLFMPRWASAIDLRVLDVQTEQLKDIDDFDAIGEGVRSDVSFPRAMYATEWDQIHGEGSFKKNPWVHAITFERAA